MRTKTYALCLSAIVIARNAYQSLLAGISPHDPAVFSVAIGLTLGLALIGTLLPAIRAARVSPLEATRE